MLSHHINLADEEPDDDQRGPKHVVLSVSNNRSIR